MMLYIHIPFCEKKCDYCDFLSFKSSDEEINSYVISLCNEIEKRRTKNIESLSSIYIGGGTPSILPTSCLEKIFSTIFKFYILDNECEITLEVNPGVLTEDFLDLIEYLPVNRVSMGLQSTDNGELNRLGRIHDFKTFVNSYESILKSGIKNVNIDIMTGIPGQTLNTLENTLNLVKGLNPAHISSYALMLEPGTPFFEKYKKFTAPLPDEETEYKLYRLPIDYLTSNGYERYEISNFAKPKRASKHNLGYWNRNEYIGLGLGASSFINHKRYKNTSNIDIYYKYCNSETGDMGNEYYEENRSLSKDDEIAEFMYLGLRKTSGVSYSKFYNEFNVKLDEIYSDELKYLRENGFIEKGDYTLKLTDLGMDLSNQVLAWFLRE